MNVYPGAADDTRLADIMHDLVFPVKRLAHFCMPQ